MKVARFAPEMPAPTDAELVPIVAWPLSDEQRAHVLRLGQLIQRFGPARFTRAHVVRADERDFPDPWEPTLAALQRLLHRLCWHAHFDPEIAIDDLRFEADPGFAMLTNSSIDFVEAKDGRATFQVAAFGNDDIAGLLTHAVGAAFLAVASADPFRPLPSDPTEVDASIAACYLGLGVLVANASMYRRYRSQLVGREVRSEQRIEITGGLSIADVTLLLAIQLTVRDDVPDAVETLHAPQREWIERWLAVLDPHEDELRALLGLDAASDEAALPERDPAPRVPAPITEPVLGRHNAGRLSFRIPRRRHRLWAGLGVGFLLMIALRVLMGGSVALLLLVPIGAIGGLLITRPGFACAACNTTMPTELGVCPTCHVTLEDTLGTRALQDARRALYAARAEEVDPEYAAEAERGYHPDV